MENVIHRLTLDLTGADMMPRVEVQQDNARSIVIALTQGGRPYWIAEGVTAVFSARKPDGNPLFNACTIEKNRVRYDFTDQTTNVAGIVECEILLYDADGKRLASSRFELAIDELIHRDGDVPESAPELSALTQMVADGTAMIEDLRKALAGLEGVEEILTQTRAAMEDAEAAASHAADSEAAARGHAKTAADAAADALTLAGQANSASQQSNKYAYEALQHRQAAEAAAERAKEAAANLPQGGVNGSGQNGTLSEAEKTLILALFRNAAYVSDNMGDTLEQLETLWGGGGEEPENPDVPEIPDEPDEPEQPEKTLTGISATYSGGDVAAGTAVSALTGVVVTAHYSDGTSEAVTGYTLSGEIAAGENTVTVSYGGKTATFAVTGIAESSGLPQYEYTVLNNSIFNADGTSGPSAQFDATDFIDIDPNYSTMSVATYLDAVSDTRISSGSYVQWFNGDTFLSRTGGSPVIEIGKTKCTKPVVHTMPEGATKFRICVQNNCDRFVLYKGTVSASDI